MIVRVYTIDGESIALPIYAWTTIRNLREKTAEKLGIKDFCPFAIYEVKIWPCLREFLLLFENDLMLIDLKH